MKKGLRRRIIERLLFVSILAGALHFLLPRIAAIEDILKTLSHLNWGLLGAAAAFECAYYAAGGSMIRQTVRSADSTVGIGSATMLNLCGNSIGLLVAGVFATIPATFRWLRLRNVKGSAAWLASWAPIVIDNTLLLAFALIGMIQLYLIHALPTGIRAALLSLALIFSLIMAAIALSLWQGPLLARVIAAVVHRIGIVFRRPWQSDRIQEALEPALAATGTMLKKSWKPVIGSGATAIFCDAVCLYIMFLAAGQKVELGVFGAGYGLPLVLGRFAPIPGGVGIVEASMIGLYTTMGIPSQIAVVAVLGYRIISFWIPSIVGFGLLPLAERERKERGFIA